jgi:hypothetical protein
MHLTTARTGARLVEASMRIIPEPDMSIYTAIQQAELAGYTAIEVHPDNTATVIFHRETPSLMETDSTIPTED